MEIFINIWAWITLIALLLPQKTTGRAHFQSSEPKNSNLFEIIENNIIIRDPAMHHEINRVSGKYIRRFHKFGFTNITIEGVLCPAKDAVDFVTRWSKILDEDELDLSNNVFWLLTERLFNHKLYESVNDTQVSTVDFLSNMTTNLKLLNNLERHTRVLLVEEIIFMKNLTEIKSVLSNINSPIFIILSFSPSDTQTLQEAVGKEVLINHLVDYNWDVVWTIKNFGFLMTMFYAAIALAIWIYSYFNSKAVTVIHTMFTTLIILKGVEWFTYYLIGKTCFATILG